MALIDTLKRWLGVKRKHPSDSVKHTHVRLTVGLSPKLFGDLQGLAKSSNCSLDEVFRRAFTLVLISSELQKRDGKVLVMSDSKDNIELRGLDS